MGSFHPLARLVLVVIAAVLVVPSARLGAVIDGVLSGGPLWWLPDNSGSYSRHHDFWILSSVEETAPGVATSFEDYQWEADVSGAPPNSACDVQNGVERDNVGPPYPAAGVDVNRTARTPDGGGGGLGGFQASLQLGEWWQGTKYAGYLTRDDLRAEHFAPGWAEADYGVFRVRVRNNSGQMIEPVPAAGELWLDYPQAGGQFHLFGGGAGTVSCVGTALVNLHGHRGHQSGAFPLPPAGADGNPCWSQPRLLVLRSNSEARCEPDLAQRYASTERFYDIFDNATEPVEAHLRPYEGDARDPIFPPDYAAPYGYARRVEFGLFTVGEAVDTPSGANMAAIGWDTPGFDGLGAEHAARDRVSRFVGPSRPRPFGGSTVRLWNDDLDATECIEIGPAGWDASTGTYDPRCADTAHSSPYTARLNAEVPGGTRAARFPELGPVDNRATGVPPIEARGLSGAAPFAAPSGFEWFEHQGSTFGCVFLQRRIDWGVIDAARDAADDALAAAAGSHAAWNGATCPACTVDPVTLLPDCRARDACQSAIDSARSDEVYYRGLAYGWRLIADYRQVVLSELDSALTGAGYGSATSNLVAAGYGSSLQNRRCYTGPVGGAQVRANVLPSRMSESGLGGQAGGELVLRNEHLWFGSDYTAGVPGSAERYGTSRDSAAVISSRAYEARRPGSEPPRALEAMGGMTGVRRGGLVYRELPCPTGGEAYYAEGVEAVGTEMLDHRSAPPGRAWAVPDSELVGAGRGPFPSGLPCINPADPDIPAAEAERWRELAEAYNVRAPDGTLRCYEADYQVSGGVGSWVPTASARGSYRPGTYRLGYSGDGPGTTEYGVTTVTRPVAYYVLPGSPHLRLDASARLFTVGHGVRTLDVQGNQIWSGYGTTPGLTLVAGEVLEGPSSGWCSGGEQNCDPPNAPVDRGEISHSGPVRFFGSMVIGGTGGCTLSNEDTARRFSSVLDGGQRVLCLLPTGVDPSGKCPGPGIP